MSLDIKDVSKRYKNGVIALDHFTLKIDPGMFGLLGPNGAGKSTLMRILSTLQLPDEGSITFQGTDVLKDPFTLRSQLGYLPQSFGVYPKEHAKSLLSYLAVLKGISSRKQRSLIVDEVLDRTNLTDVQYNYVSDYSGGMKQRFGIAQLLLNRPKLIIVDEPTAGLDPSERKRFLNVLKSVGAESTVIFSTHIVEDVRELCNDMAIMNRGIVLKHQSPQSAIADIQGFVWLTEVSESELIKIEERYKVLSKNFTQDNKLLIRVFSKSQPESHFYAASPTLEDVYFLTLLKGESCL